MLNFRNFITECEGLDIPVIRISKETIDCSKEETQNEINDNLEDGLTGQHWRNPYGGWLRSAKILSLYGINLPRIVFKDIFHGEEVVAISQFGDKVGEKTDGEVVMTPDEAEYYFYYSYTLLPDGHYESFAVVTDEAGLEELVSDDTEHLDPTGEKQPPQ
jgi:hypothetical protein